MATVNFRQLKKNLSNQAAKAPAVHAEKKQQQRDRYLHNVMSAGGKGFLRRIKRYGTTEKGQPLILRDHYCEYLLLLGDYRISWVLTTGSAQVGKASPLDSKILTPTGWRLMGEIAIGDQVIAADGTVTEVTGVFPQGIKKIYRVTMEDGGSMECCDEHLFMTQTSHDRGIRVTSKTLKPKGNRQRDWEPMPDGSRPGTVKSLAEIRETFYQLDISGQLKRSRGKTRTNHSIPLVAPVQFAASEPPINPYLMGLLLGDGHLRADSISFSKGDEEIIKAVEFILEPGYYLTHRPNTYDYRICSPHKGFNNRENPHIYIKSIKDLGLIGKKSANKFVPDIYKFGSVETRLAILQGLLDADGTANKKGLVSFCSTSTQLIADISELILSLGGMVSPVSSRVSKYTYKGEKKDGQRSYQIFVTMPDVFAPFRLTRKLQRYESKVKKRSFRHIKSIIEVGEKQVQCISIDHSSHLYVADDYIVTHNTLGHTFLLIDTVVCGKLNGAWFYDSKTSLDQYAPMQFRPTAKAWIAGMLLAGYKMRLGGDREVNTNYQVDGANAIFSFVSTSKTSRAEAGGAAAAAVASSFSADIAVMEERSQYPPGSADVCLDRLSSSIVPTKPRRDLGTSGGGLGIESDMRDCHYYFYPHYDCPHCGENLPLDPNGCLLKQVERTDLVGKRIKTYLSETGRPIEWHHYDPLDVTQSAYIGCSKCGCELSDEDRLDRSRYRCTQTGVFLKDFIEALPAGEPERALKVGLHMSPLTREGKARSIAVDIIRRGLATSNPANWQQQVLGHYSQTDTLKLTHLMIRDRIGAPLPPGAQRHYRIAGCDIGRGEDWLFIFDVYLPPVCDGLTVAQIAELSIRNVVYAEAVVRSDIPTILETWQVDFGLVDNEPSIESVMGLATETCLQMANQVGRAKVDIKHNPVTDGGIQYPCWSLRNQKFMLAVFEGFTVRAWDGEIRYRVPETWEKWLTDSSERSPIVHLTAPWRDTSDHWHRGKNNLDDFYMAALFAEAALYLQLTEDFNDEEMLIDSYVA